MQFLLVGARRFNFLPYFSSVWLVSLVAKSGGGVFIDLSDVVSPFSGVDVVHWDRSTINLEPLIQHKVVSRIRVHRIHVRVASNHGPLSTLVVDFGFWIRVPWLVGFREGQGVLFV